jgi:small-conductance mechanosensitive channel
MPDIAERARALIQEAQERGRCLDFVKTVERRMEDLKDAGSTGNGAIAVGFGFIVIGAVVAIFVPPLGAGLAAGGAAGVAGGLGAKGSAAAHAAKELRRAVDDLEECLRRP